MTLTAELREKITRVTCFESLNRILPEKLDFDEVKEIANILNKSLSFSCLDFTNLMYKFNSEQLKEILLIFKDNTYLKSIKLLDCKINDEIATIIIGIIKKNPFLKKFTLYGGKIEIVDSNISEDLISSLQSRKELKTLDISYTNMDNKLLLNIIHSVTHNPNFRVLSISSLKLEYNHITAICKLLKQNQLTSLYLENNEIFRFKMSRLAEFLEKCTKLKSLCITDNGLGDKEAEHLAKSLKHLSLIRLELENNDLNDIGAVKISYAIKNMPELTHINMQSNRITYEGIIKILENLKDNPSLKALHLSRNSIEDSEIFVEKELEDILKDLQGINPKKIKKYLKKLEENGELKVEEVSSQDDSDITTYDDDSLLSSDESTQKDITNTGEIMDGFETE